MVIAVFADVGIHSGCLPIIGHPVAVALSFFLLARTCLTTRQTTLLSCDKV